MKISSKSILSPARAGSARDPPISLSASLSRRLRSSRSIKGGASPAMFPATGKRRGSGFDNPEPSSPKVTCIGQVRVKSKKKHGKNMRTLSRRHSTGELSRRKLEHSRDGFGSQSQPLGSNYQQGGHNQHQNQECLPGQRNNQRWVHLPLTICETLRAFGSEFSCLFPCRPSCFSTTGTDKEEKLAAGSAEGNRQGSCRAVFGRWLVALQDGDDGGRAAPAAGGGGREIELVSGNENDEDEEMGVRYSRRHVFQDLDIVNDNIQGSQDESRVSICVPPKNALLLMRCRSDPVKMEAFTNRFWVPSLGENEEEDEEFIDGKYEFDEKKVPQEALQMQKEEKLIALVEVNDQERDHLQEATIDQEKIETNLEIDMKQRTREDDQEQSIETGEEEDRKQSIENSEEQDQEQSSIEISEEEDQEQSVESTEEEEESMFLLSLFEENAEQDQELEENDEANSDMEDAREELFEEDDVQETEAGKSNIEKVKEFEEKNEDEMATEGSETPEETHEEVVKESEEVENASLEEETVVKEERESSRRVLPECLLLMMYEPKLSMEVSKETWVCSTDFIRHRKKPPPPQAWLPPIKSIVNQDEPKVNTTSPTAATRDCDDHVMSAAAAQYEPVLQQLARSSCSLPAPQLLEQKLVKTVGYEPFALMRCKSEPMRTAATKLVPETCFWKNRKLEPLRRNAFGIGMAGLGF